jgi:hypothetical protein
LSIFQQLTQERGDSPDLIRAMEETVDRLVSVNAATDARHPGMLLGKIQAGKTRAFIGIIAKAFDEGFNFAIVLTKGTQALAEQTIKRISKDFAAALEDDKVKVYDIMHLPKNLTRFHLRQKWILVVKKEKNNLKRTFEALEEHYPDLKSKRLLIVDDEADYATLAFRKSKDSDEIEAGKIAQWIDQLRARTAGVAFLQVTATPYSLYLQPSDTEDSPLFHPVRPAFTVLLPTHETYVGGDFFFGASDNEDSPASFVYEEVSLDERNALKKPDRRSFRLEEALTSSRVAALRRALLNFVVGGTIRRMQQRNDGVKAQKYAFIVHTESARSSHAWQENVVGRIFEELVGIVSSDKLSLERLVRESYEDLLRSLKFGKLVPLLTDVLELVKAALVGQEVMVTVVNSENQVKDQLDEEGQLRLDAPLNVFIGGQILDRGITIRNLIGFYYGRNPGQFQQDTVLQHARLYGARAQDDLLVTRFYTTDAIHLVMKRIHEFDTALRSEIEKGGHASGVYFLRRDGHGHIIPCSPNKILASEIVTIRSHRRLLPIGFQTGYKSYVSRDMERLDAMIEALLKPGQPDDPVLISVDVAAEILRSIEKTLAFEESDYQWDFEGHIAALEHLAQGGHESRQGRVWLFVRRDRDLARFREGGRFSNEPLSYQERPVVNKLATDVPVLAVIGQRGREEQKWRGVPFWWPVIVPPGNTPTTIFASKTRGD